MSPVRRVVVTLKPHEHHARRLLAIIACGITVMVAVFAVLVPIFRHVDAKVCDAAIWPETIRNSTVYPQTRPSCGHGTWTVTTTRQDIPEDAYGWNCFLDGNGVCGPLETLDRDCLTDPDDGYTMCPDGRVYYRDAAGGKLWPVTRDPS